MISLRRKADFHTLLHHGRRTYGSWAVLYTRLRSPSDPSARGEPGSRPRFAVSTRGKFPNAVQRNRARRLVRETCRPIISGLREPWDVLFIVRPGILTTTFSDRRQALLHLLRQTGLPIEEPDSGRAAAARPHRSKKEGARP